MIVGMFNAAQEESEINQILETKRMSKHINYVYRVRDKKTGEFKGNGKRSIWIRRSNAAMNFPRQLMDGRYEVVMFELKEVKE